MKKINELDELFDYMEDNNYLIGDVIYSLEKEESRIELGIKRGKEKIVLIFNDSEIDFKNIMFEEEITIEDLIFFEAKGKIHFEVVHDSVSTISIKALKVEMIIK